MSLMIGTQLYGWGQVYAQRGVTLDDHLPEVLSAIRDMGMATAESASALLDAATVPAWGRLLCEHGLTPASIYSGGAFHEEALAAEALEGLTRAGEALAASGFSVLVLNPNPIGREKTDAELATQAAYLQRLGERLAGMGVALGLHNHTPEMVSGAREFHFNLRETDPAAVGLCMDVHWCWRGGSDPWALYEEYADRLVSLHLRQSVGGVWSEAFGEGDLDYRPMMQDLNARQFAGPVIIELALEADTPQTRDVVENNRLSFEYLKSLL